MSFITLTDNLGNSYQLTSGDRITSLAASDYFTAIDALERIDYLQLAAAEDELFQWTDWHPEFGLTVNSGPGWQSTESTNLFQTQAHHPHIGSRFLPDRWPQILDAIYRGNLRFVQVDAAKTSKNENPQDTRSILRVKIRQALLTIVAAEKAEAAHHARRLQQETSVNRGLIYTGAFLTGLWQAGAGFAQWLKEVNDVLNPLQRSLRGVRATQRALQRNESGESLLAAYRDEMLIAEKREIVQALGFDPTAITRQQFQHAIELADLIWEDPSLQADLRRFVKDYVSAQHTIEITEFSGAAAFEVLFTILLAAVTGGTGLAASAANLTRYFARFRKVGELLVEFGEQVKKSRLLRDRNAPAKQSPGFEDFESLGEVEIPTGDVSVTHNRKNKPNVSEGKSKIVTEVDYVPSVNGSSPKVLQARQRQAQMLEDNIGFNISPTAWDAYPTIGKSGTFISDRKGITDIVGDFSGQSTLTLNKAKVLQLEEAFGLEKGTLEEGFKIRQVDNIIDRMTRSPMEGNQFFLGPGNHLPGGAPEMVIDSIPTIDTDGVKTLLEVVVE
ncbi:hypothetical protein [Microbulbifer pacificus]|uniref:hypothetical protein n=1 Tax=Microbulbifer pacificus TaxID=407164 RepID=UPI0018F8A66B|nr:hypothetical protein [Microbulbifer pacificus]